MAHWLDNSAMVWPVLAGVAAPWLGYFLAILWLMSRLEVIRLQPDKAYLVPQASSAQNFVWVLSWWIWTKYHREFGDRSASAAVMLCRILLLASAATAILLAYLA